LLMVIGGGAILGSALWRLASGDGMDGGRWIIVGVVLVTGAWLTWGAAGLKRSRRPQAAPPAPPPTQTDDTPSSEGDSLASRRLRLRANGSTAFVGVGLILLAWSTRAEDVPVRIGLPFGPAWHLSSGDQYLGLASFFLFVSLFALIASIPGLGGIIRKIDSSVHGFEPALAFVGVISLLVGWASTFPIVSDLPSAWAYPLGYGGLAVVILVWGLLIWDIYAPMISNLFRWLKETVIRRA